MYRVHLDVSEIDQFGRRLSHAADDIVDDAEALVARTTYLMMGQSQVNAPVETGFLVASHSADIDGLHAEWGPTAHYADYVERGTSKMAAQPYVGPAFDAHEDAFIAGVAALGLKGI